MSRRLASNLTVQVLFAVAAGVLIGILEPRWGVALRPLADGFIRLVKMVVAPVIFLTIVGGIAGMGDLRRVGRVGLKALVYFEIVSTLALAIGLVVANLVRPGEGIDVSRFVTPDGASKAAPAPPLSEFLLSIIPQSILGPFVGGDSLQVLFLALLVGIAVATLGAVNTGGSRETAAWVLRMVERLTEVIFRVVAIVMRGAPIGALGAMAFTVGEHGMGSLAPLAKLMGCVYLTMAVFVVAVLGGVLRLCGVSLWRYLGAIRAEILLVLGTSSSESALPRLIATMRKFGCGHETTGLVVPAGYSFNLDGTSIYLSMAVLFIAQAYGVPLSLGKQIGILGVLMLTSKGAAAVTGGGFVTLAATLSATHVLPVEGLALLLGVDRFMSEARAVTNLIGNGVAAVAVSRSEGELRPAGPDASD